MTKPRPADIGEPATNPRAAPTAEGLTCPSGTPPVAPWFDRYPGYFLDKATAAEARLSSEGIKTLSAEMPGRDGMPATGI
jgi:hypothetical protein